MRILVRATVFGLFLAGILSLATAAPVRAARPADGAAVIGLLGEDRAAGRISTETYFLETFRYVFAPELADPRYAPEQHTPLKCVTPLIREFDASRSGLSGAAVAEIEGYIRPAGGAALRASYVSPSGRFELVYYTTGGNAVPSEDINPPNGIPDFVERCAEYLDTSWDTEITTLGFMAPLLPADGTYDISFQNMSAYGYTSPVGAGRTAITLENDFVGFPPNTDPDGRVLGAAKVTCAHEFKHASQYTNNSWSEGGWVELDATWMEDIVYDDTNDYYNYINYSSSNSQLSDPWLALDNGGTGSYEDCLWQHYLSEKYGVQIIVDLWGRRRTNPAESMKASYAWVQQQYGTGWPESWSEMYEWCWFTGSREELPYGFGESPSYLRMNLRTGSAVSSYPYNTTDAVDQIAAHPYRFNSGTAGKHAQIHFDGDDAHPDFRVSVIVEEPESTGVFTVLQPALDANQDFEYMVPLSWDDIQYVGVIVTNTKRSDGAKSYSLTVTEVDGGNDVSLTGSPLAARLELRPAAPNPFRIGTRIGYALPRETRATVRILDVAGRTVRVLHQGVLPAGEGEILWDGLDRDGRKVPAGVYWSRIETPEGSVARKVTALR